MPPERSAASFRVAGAENKHGRPRTPRQAPVRLDAVGRRGWGALPVEYVVDAQEMEGEAGAHEQTYSERATLLTD